MDCACQHALHLDRLVLAIRASVWLRQIWKVIIFTPPLLHRVTHLRPFYLYKERRRF